MTTINSLPATGDLVVRLQAVRSERIRLEQLAAAYAFHDLEARAKQAGEAVMGLRLAEARLSALLAPVVPLQLPEVCAVCSRRHVGRCAESMG